MTGFQSDFSLETAPSMVIGDFLDLIRFSILSTLLLAALCGCGETPVAAPAGNESAFHELQSQRQAKAAEEKFADFRGACAAYYEHKNRIRDLESKMSDKNATEEEITERNGLLEITQTERFQLEQFIRNSTMSKDDRQVMVWILNTPPQNIVAR